MMFKRCGESEHYKMYKKGKTWVFAGIVSSLLMMTSWGVETVHADTVNDDTMETSQQVVKATADEQAKQATLKPANEVAPTGKMSSEKESPEEVVPKEEPSSDETKEANVPLTEDQESNPEDGDGTIDKVSVEQKKVANSDTVKRDESATGDSQLREINEEKDNLDVDSGKLGAADTQLRPNNRLMRTAAIVSPVADKAAVVADQSIDEWMPNKTLQQSIFKTLTMKGSLLNPMVTASGKTWNNVNDITKDDMALLEYFSFQGTLMTTYIDGKTSFSLEGLQYAKNLTYLDLKGNLTFLGGTTLVNHWGPNLADGKFNGDITDISPLSGLTKLEFLQLAENRITDVTPLAGLKNLKTLQMPYNCVSDFSSLDYAQYTDRMTFDHQLIIHDPVVVNGTTRTYTTPITVKLPQNFNSALASNVGKGWIDDTDLAVYSFSSGGTGTPDGKGNIVYTDIKDQIMPGTDATALSGFKTTPQPYTYYLSRVYYDQSNPNLEYFFDYTPYTIAAEAQAVTVHYQDTTGKAIAKDNVLPTGMVGDAYTTEPLTIPGYTLKTTPENATGTYGDEPIEIIYVYTKNTTPVTPPVVTPEQTVTVTVHYQTADGTQVAPDVIITGKAGDAYATHPAANVPAGYELATTPTNANGTFGNSDIAITYVYAQTGGDGDKVSPESNQPAKDSKPMTQPATKLADKANGEPTKSGAADKIAGNKASSTVAKGGAATKVDLTKPTGTPKSMTQRTTLPQTDEQATTTSLWGLALLGGLLSLVGIKLKKREH